MKLGIIGCGNMGEALLSSIIKTKALKAEDIIVAEKNPQRHAVLEQKYGIKVTDNINELSTCPALLLAIKPQALEEFHFTPNPRALIISILAGTGIKKLKQFFPDAKIARAMPNLGQFAEQGMTGIFLDAQINEIDKTFIDHLFAGGSKVLFVDEEEKIDKITAISGSGPAYFFLLSECMVRVAEDFGFSKNEADLLVRQTLKGASAVTNDYEKGTFEEWRTRVTSPGGTTQQAIETLNKGKFSELVNSAMNAALKRAKEISGNLE